jgi:hypothetical protein
MTQKIAKRLKYSIHIQSMSFYTVIRAPNIAQNQIAKRSESENFFAKNCEAKRSENIFRLCEAKRSEQFFKIAKNCEKLRNCEKIFNSKRVF